MVRWCWAMLVVGVVGCDAGRDSTVVDGSDAEQGRLEGTRLTRPFIEDPGVRDGSARMIELRERVGTRVTAARRADSTLHVSFYARSLENGDWTAVAEDDRYLPASLMKVPVLYHALTRLEADPPLGWRTFRYPGAAEMPSPDNLEGVAPPRHMVPGEEYTLLDLLLRMVAYSDNHAKDLVMAGVDPAQVDALMAQVGLPDMHDTGGRVEMTARSYATLFRMLYYSSVFSRATSEFALDLLSRADFAAGIRAGVPEGTVVASKYGVHLDPEDPASGTQLHECGIVYLPGDPFTLCVMTRSQTATTAQLAELVSGLTDTAWGTLSGTGT